MITIGERADGRRRDPEDPLPCSWCGDPDPPQLFTLVGLTVCRRCRDRDAALMEPLSQERFAALVATVPMEIARWCHRRRFPTGPATARLDDEARGRLWHSIAWSAAGRPASSPPHDPFPWHLLPGPARREAR